MIFAFEVPVAVVTLGLIIGMTYGILAVGLVLIYRTTKVVNFAHGQIGAFGAALLGLAVTRWNAPYWLMFPVVLIISAAIAGLVEVGVMRRLRRAPKLMAMVATLGVSQVLLLLAVVINGQAAAGQFFPQPPWLPDFRIGALRVTPAYSGMLFLTPIVVLGLVGFFRYTRLGLATRAAAANPDAARADGVFASRMSLLAWLIAGAVSGFTALLVLPTQGFSTAEPLGPSLLVRALAAAVVARMESLPIALAAGLGVGVLEQVTLWNQPRSGIVDMALLGAILVALVLQRRQGGRDSEKGSWAAVEPWPQLPDAARQVWSVRYLGLIVGALALVVALLVPAFVTNHAAIVLVTIMAYALIGLSVSIVTGLSGQLTLGQFALAGVGAAVSFVFTRGSGNFVIGALLAGFVTAGVSVLIGLPALRIKGLLLAVTTLAFAVAAQSWLFSRTWMFGSGVEPGRPVFRSFEFDTSKRYYYFALAFLVFGLWLARNVRGGGMGRRLLAVRDNEEGARAFSIDATRVTLQGFAVAGFLAGLGGAVYGHSLSLLSQQAFPVGAGIELVAMAVVGGIGTLAGPLLGALYILGVPKFLPLDSAGLAATATGWLVLVMAYPGGVAQAMRPLRDGLVAVLLRRHGVALADESDTTPLDTRALVPSRSPTHGPGTERDGQLLSVNGLAKRFDGIHAVRDVSLSVTQGETLGLIGPNGAGKTTLFELISGFTRHDRGSIEFDGRDISRLSPNARAHAGLIRSFQDAALFSTLTVADTVKLSLEKTMPTRALPSLVGLGGVERRRDARSREVMATMGLERYRDTQIRALSTGTRRIVEIACLIALEPRLLLLDEPSSGVAQRETEALGLLLARVREELDTTMVVIEHDIPLVMSIADRVIAMESGAIIADGTPAAIRSDPLVIEAYLGGDLRAIERSGLRTAAPKKRRRATKAAAR